MRFCLLASLSLAAASAAKHVLEELELSLGHRGQQEKSPEGLDQVEQH